MYRSLARVYEDLLKRDKLNLDFLRDDEPPFADAAHFLTGRVTAAFCFSFRASYEARALPWRRYPCL